MVVVVWMRLLWCWMQVMWVMRMWLLWLQLESICTSESGSVTSSEALNLTDQLDRQKRLSKADTELFLTRLVREKWLMVNTHTLASLANKPRWITIQYEMLF